MTIGVPRGRKPWVIVDVDLLVSLYESGVPLSRCAHQLGVSRPALTARLVARGVAIRGSRLANRARMAALTAEQRSTLTSAAHAAVRGSTQTREYLLRRAHLTATNGRMTTIERVFFDALVELGHSPVPQFQVDIYNIDLALVEQRIAIEVDPGHWHTTAPKIRQDQVKSDCLQRHGWRVVRFAGKHIREKNPNLTKVARECVASLGTRH